MSLAQWPVRRLAWLWGAVLIYMAALVLLTITQTRARSREFDIHLIRPDTAQDRQLSPAAGARADSFADSLKRIAQRFLHSKEGRAAVQDVYVVLGKASRGAARLALIELAIFFTPATAMAILTLVWFRRRRLSSGDAGA